MASMGLGTLWNRLTGPQGSIRSLGSARTWGSAAGSTRLFGRRGVAEEYLCGEGIEIGALHNPLKVPAAARVTYVDRMSYDDLIRAYPTMANKGIVRPAIIDNGETLATLANASQDFVIANHMIEHAEDPVSVIENFLRVVKPGGVIYLTIPDMRGTFDRHRPETTVEHLLRDYREGPAWSRRDHFVEYAQLVDQVTEPAALAAHVEHLIRTEFNIHYHCWSQRGMWAWLSALQMELKFPFDVEFYLHRKSTKGEGEGIFILKKHL